MTYDKEKLFKKAMAIIKKDKEIIFIEDLCLSLGIAKKTFYEYFPTESNEINELKDAISQNKTNKKKRLRTKWAESDNATLNVCLYKLLSTDEERKLLADKQELQHSGDKDNPLELIHVYIPDNGRD